MQQHITIIVPSAATDALIQDLERDDGVITLSVERGHAVKPRGDVVHATVLNSATDDVLKRVELCSQQGPISVSESAVDSLSHARAATQIRKDVDEATWETSETGLRKHSRPTINFMLACITGGVIAMTSLLTTSGITEATALVAAAIIAPVFEPVARIALAAVKGRWDVLVEAAWSMLLGYGIVIASTIVTMLAFRLCGHHFELQLDHDRTVHDIDHYAGTDLVISAAGALAGAVMVSAGRFTTLAGPIVALQLLPAAAALGGGIAEWHETPALHGLARLGIDVGFVLVAGLVVFAAKDALVHGRRQTFR